VTDRVRQEESAVAQGTRWLTVALVIVGLCNYAYALLLTHLLDACEYSRFAAGQGLILWPSTVAAVFIPWALAQALAQARSDNERNAATRFAEPGQRLLGQRPDRHAAVAARRSWSACARPSVPLVRRPEHQRVHGPQRGQGRSELGRSGLLLVDTVWPSTAERGLPTTVTSTTTSGMDPTTPSSGRTAWSRCDGRG
jgi:hypothetical protein